MSGQPSQNKLIVFSDGTYLELFNWVDRPPHSNAWADKSPGLIDFALTTLPPSSAESVQEEIRDRLQRGSDAVHVDFKYKVPEAGGRLRKDGVEVKWKLSRPIPVSDSLSASQKVSASGHRKDLPFFTHDVTARNVRVPFDDVEKTTHPCGATGISAVEVLYPKLQYPEYVMLYEKLLGTLGKPSEDKQCHEFYVESPVKDICFSRIIVSAGKDEDEHTSKTDYAACIRGLRLHVKDREGHGLQALSSGSSTTSVFLEW